MNEFLIVGEKFDSKTIAGESFTSWCEQHNDDDFQSAWDEWERVKGKITLDDKVLLNLIEGAIKFGVESALSNVSDRV